MSGMWHQVFEYENRPVLERFKREYPEKATKADVIFSDLMRFFWASKKHFEDHKLNPQDPALDFIFIMDEEMKDIDIMWHVFLLYTKDYMEFCDKYFNEYIHHLPDIVPNLPQDSQAFQLNLEKFLNYCYDNLGETVIRRWFNEEEVNEENDQIEETQEAVLV